MDTEQQTRCPFPCITFDCIYRTRDYKRCSVYQERATRIEAGRDRRTAENSAGVTGDTERARSEYRRVETVFPRAGGTEEESGRGGELLIDPKSKNRGGIEQ